MTPGTLVRVKPEWRHFYRKEGTATVGIIEALSPSGSVARVRLDHLAGSFVMVAHLATA